MHETHTQHIARNTNTNNTRKPHNTQHTHTQQHKQKQTQQQTIQQNQNTYHKIIIILSQKQNNDQHRTTHKNHSEINTKQS